MRSTMKKNTIKKIEVCHGPTCGPNGANEIQRKISEAFKGSGTEVIGRGCCGRCQFNNTIVADGQPISKLSPKTVQEKFVDDPDTAIAAARETDAEILKELDAFLRNDSVY